MHEANKKAESQQRHSISLLHCKELQCARRASAPVPLTSFSSTAAVNTIEDVRIDKRKHVAVLYVDTPCMSDLEHMIYYSKNIIDGILLVLLAVEAERPTTAASAAEAVS